MANNNVKEPATVEEANIRIYDLKSAVYDIQEQLRRGKDRKLHSRRYYAWRRRAVDKLKYLQIELSAIKQWKSSYFTKRNKQLAASMDADGLLYKAYKIIKLLMNAGGELTEDKQNDLDGIQAYLRSLL